MVNILQLCKALVEETWPDCLVVAIALDQLLRLNQRAISILTSGSASKEAQVDGIDIV